MKVEQRPNTPHAIYDNADRLPTFGNGHDLCIVSGCLSSDGNYSNLTGKKGYKAPYVKDCDPRYVLLGGYNFKCEEVEVY